MTHALRSLQAIAIAVAAALSAAPLSACGRNTAAMMTELPEPTTTAHELLPAPRSVRLSLGDSFAVSRSTTILFNGDDDARRVAHFLAAYVGSAFGGAPLRVAPGRTLTRGDIMLRLGGADSLGNEGYELAVMPDGITVTARAPAGLFYGFQTLRQLLPATAETPLAAAASLKAPAARIVDFPRFEWRGAMLDVSRHFLRPADVKRYIELMALHKLNRLHLHLSDDQGWRIEIRSWPNLARRGGSTQVGGGPGGYYTQEEYADIVRYAHDRFITVVPEIDMPGHTNAALASYPELNCDNRAPALYTGTRVGFSALCVQKEITYRFVNDVVREIAALTPGPYFHVGGDEVERLTAQQYRAFVERAQEIVRSHGKVMIGWGEIAPASLHPSTIVQQWRPNASPRQAVARGNRVILSPANRIYLDMKYDSTTRLGLTWAAMTEIWDAYGWDPATLFSGVPEEAILGVEGPLWSETVVTISDFEYLAFPRLAAVAEIGWTPQSQRSWDGFRVRLGAQAPRWSALNINFHRSPRVPWR